MESKTPNEFTPPKHWISDVELDPAYWADTQAQELRGQEFAVKPVEWLEKQEAAGNPESGLARREFLTVMGASMALAATACARRPVNKIIPYVTKPEDVTPGVANHYASTFSDGPTPYGILVKVREGRPVKIEGNEQHPINQGKLCVRGQASLLSLYDPERLKAPAKRMRGNTIATGETVSWTDADAAIVAKLKTAASSGARVRLLSGIVKGDTQARLVRDFLGAFRGSELVEWEPLAGGDVAEGQALAYGSAVLPAYRFDKADFVLSLGADFLGTWISPVEHAGQWAKTRKLEGGRKELSKLYVFESMMTSTGASADERYPVRPGDELKIALAVAHELIVTRKLSSYSGDGAVSGALAAWKPELVAEEVSLDGGAEVIKRVATQLWNARGKSLVVAGGVAAQTADAAALQVVANLLNSALQNEGATVDGNARATAARGGFAGVHKLIGEMKAGQVDVLIVHGSNAQYWLPNAVSGFADAVAKVPFVVSIADREDETARLGDYVLPEHHYLENWGDSNPRRGVYSLQQPVIAPLHETRAFEDTLLTWTKTLKGGAGPANWHDYLKAAWRETHFAHAGAGTSFEQFWEGALRTGIHTAGDRGANPSARSFRSAAMAVVPRDPASRKVSGLQLALYPKISMGDGRMANNAWVQEVPDPITSACWDNYLNISPSTAKALNIRVGEQELHLGHPVVEVTVDGVKIELPVNVQPGLHKDTITAAIGYGRTAAGKVGSKAGVDVFGFAKILPASGSEGAKLVLSGRPATIRSTGKFYRIAKTQWSTATQDRPVINDISLAAYKKDPGAMAHTNPHLKHADFNKTMWGVHEYKGHKWGMAIDLNSCIGCQACMVACQSENNIAVVGRDNVRVSRQMHWIRIDRYYSGNPERPDVVFQPMLCQHCDNAPCETVCPVLATVHNDEGLNVQVYNRCVGTRYCSNNCPYKVRRFNFFDHWKNYESTMNLAWNPDVTVRTRGIMEKCTFCTQRITEGKDAAKDRGEKVKDGEIQVACEQTCPTDAIVFGDMNDPTSRISKLAREQRAFRALELLNTKPAVHYLTKVRNKDTGAAEHGAAHTGGEHHS